MAGPRGLGGRAQPVGTARRGAGVSVYTLTCFYALHGDPDATNRTLAEALRLSPRLTDWRLTSVTFKRAPKAKVEKTDLDTVA
jgi:hypothetical protein